MAVKAIPDGYHSVTPYLVVPGVAQLLDSSSRLSQHRRSTLP